MEWLRLWSTSYPTCSGSAVARFPAWSDEDLLSYLRAEGDWVTVRTDSNRQGKARMQWYRSPVQNMFLATKAQLRRLADEGKIVVRTVTFSYWKGSYDRDEPGPIIQAKVR